MAAGLAAELEKGLGVKARLVPGSNGIFDVKVGDELVYSKDQTGTFPRLGEVLEILKPRFAPKD